MPKLYFSISSQDLEPVVQNIATECENLLEGKCVVGRGQDVMVAKKIRNSLERSDVLIVVIGGKSFPSKSSDLEDGAFLNERIRFEIVSAMNLDLLIVPLLIDDARLPKKGSMPGALKRLLDCKPYRLRESCWRADLLPLLEDIQDELGFKEEVEKKLSKLNESNFLGLTGPDGNPLQLHGLGLEFSQALELRRIIESERVTLEEARRKQDRAGEKKALSVMGLAFTQLGQTQKAIQLFQEQLKIVRELIEGEEALGLLANLGDAFAVSGEINQAKRYYQEQLLEADSKANRPFVASAFNGLGFVYVKLNQISKAIEYYLKALKIYREINNHDKELELLVGIGLNYQKLGNLEQVVHLMEQALGISKYLENRKEESRILVDLAEAYFELNNVNPIKDYLDRAEGMLNFFEEPWVGPLKQRILYLRDFLKRA